MTNIEKGKTKRIRNFLYLDSQKLKSASSQIFEGVTSYILQTDHETSEKFEHQKGPINSGKLLGDIFSSENSSTEMRFLEDYAYSIFEEKLFENDMIEDSLSDAFSPNSTRQFFRITNRLRINDVNATLRLLDNFNEIMENIARVTLNPMPSDGKANPSNSEIKKHISENGMQLNPHFLKSLRFLISYGVNDFLESSLECNDRLFTAPLKREFLRESAEMILYKYSRVTQSEFTLIGTVTQRGGSLEPTEILEDTANADGVKTALRTLSFHLRSVEQSFLGPLGSEIVLDPIAIYTTL